MSNTEENKYPIGGYAPGNYQCKCCTCGEQFIGDKRAVQCEPCAIKSIKPTNMSNTKTPEDFLTRGIGNFINCTDYDDAVEACKKYSAQQNRELVEALKYVVKFIPDWAEKTEPGLNPLFYGTGSYEGDLKIVERINEIKECLKEK